MKLRSKSRFDDVGPVDADGFFEYAYRGYNYEVVSGERVFCVRTYDDEPGIAVVIGPNDARTSSKARQLVDFVMTDLGCSRIKFYDSGGAYRFVDIQTLEFIE